MNYNLIMSNKYKTNAEEGERGIKHWLRERDREDMIVTVVIMLYSQLITDTLT